MCKKSATKIFTINRNILFKLIGRFYIVQSYTFLNIQNDIIISSCQDKPEYLCILYGPRLTKYKRVLPEQLASLAATNSLNLPMQRMEAMQYTPPILTNDYKI